MTTHPPLDPNASWFEETPAIAAIDVGLATSVEDFEAAFRLLHDRYVWRSYMAPEPSGRRVGVHNMLPSTKVVVVRAADRIVGTLTVLEDSCLGLPMDEAFGDQLGRLRERGRRIAEAASLAVGRTETVPGLAIVLRLLRAAIVYAARIARRDELCFTVRPRHRDFYLKLFPLCILGDPRSYRRINGADVFGVRLDLRLVRALIRAERAGMSAGPVSAFLCGPHTTAITARLRCDVPRSTLTPPEWSRLFADGGERTSEAAAFAATAL